MYYLNVNEQLGVARLTIVKLHEKIHEQRAEIERLERIIAEREQEQRWPRER